MTLDQYTFQFKIRFKKKEKKSKLKMFGLKSLSKSGYSIISQAKWSQVYVLSTVICFMCLL